MIRGNTSRMALILVMGLSIAMPPAMAAGPDSDFKAIISRDIAARPIVLPTEMPAPDSDPHCTDFAKADFSNLTEAPTKIRKTQVTRLANAPVNVCRVDGATSGNIAFQLILPLKGWNGKFIEGGCGGACGMTLPIWCNDAVAQGYSCLGFDMGHTSTTADWTWARDLAEKVDFAFRSTHIMSIAGKAMSAAYYGSLPHLSYFMGCSTGGRQAYIEAERFPADFDGIVGNSPPLNEVGSGMQLAWSTLANLDSAGNYIIQEPQAHLLYDAVVRQCDMNDGIKDGIIGDPRRCKFDPATLRCKAGQAAGCLTDAQVTAALKLYSGIVDSHGKPVVTQGGVMPGSEVNWIGDYLPRNGKAPQYLPFLTNFFTNAGFDVPPPAGWKLADMDFVGAWPHFSDNESLYNAQNPDLRAFKARGGKILETQGWGDTSVVPMGSIDYYETVTRTMGGPAATRDFYRMFMIPGMRHCSMDSTGGDSINFLATLDDWVTKGKAPDYLIGYSYDWRGPAVSSTPVFPMSPERVKLTRIHFPYPYEARYSGKGDPNDPASWKEVMGLAYVPPGGAAGKQ